MAINQIENAINKPAPTVHGFREMFAQMTPATVLITVVIVVAAYAITWAVKRFFCQNRYKGKVPNWLNILMKMLLPLLLWIFAHIAMAVYHYQSKPTVWFEFLAWMFGAWFMVRLFLFVVRRALPEGTTRETVEQISVLFIWGVMFLDYIGKLDGLLAFLDSLNLHLGKINISVLDCVTLMLTLLVLWLVMKWVLNEVDDLLFNKPNNKFAKMDLSARMVLVRLLKGILFVIAVIFSLSAAGIDLTVLSVFGGALGVGVGLGLQRIASNYVSGFVMLLERGIRIGDLITTSDNTRGVVRSINARYTLIQGASGDEVLVPNENLVINKVTNWTLNDKKNWLSTQIPVKFDIDLESIMTQITEAVSVLPRIAKTPPPRVLLSSIADNGYILEITWWLLDPENGRLASISDVNLAAWQVLRKNGIELFAAEPAPEVVENPDV